jgi:hypothetical protein
MQYFFSPRPQYITNAGVVASFGRLAFYEASTQTLKAVYDQDGVTPITNPVVLDSAGRSPAIKLGEGDYKVILESFIGYDEFAQPIYQTEWTVDPYNAASGGVIGESTVVVANISALRNIDFSEITTVYVIGYYTPGDLGQGWFHYDPTETNPDDNGSVIEPSGAGASGRWLRLFEDDVVYPQMWGAMDGIPGDTVSSRLLSMFEFVDASSLQKTIIFPEQDYPVGGSISFTGVNTEVEFKRGARITRAVDVATNVSINVKSLKVPIKNSGIVGTEIELSITTSDINAIPVSSWNGSSDSDTFNKAQTNYNGNLVVDDNYLLNNLSIDIGVDDLQFIPGGSIEVDSTGYTGTLTINRFTFAEDLTNLFRGNIEAIEWEGVSTFRVQHFTDTPNGITSAFYLTLLQSVTRNSGRYAQLIWDFYPTYTFTQGFTTSDDYRLSMTIGDDSVVQFDADVDFGIITNSPSRRILRNTGGSPILQQTLYPQWWGMTVDRSDTSRDRNSSAINDAFEAAIVSKTGVVSGNNAAVKILDQLSVNTPVNDTKTITFKDIQLLVDGDFTSVSIFTSSANCVVDNVEIDGTDNTSLNAFRIADDYKMDVVNCKLSNLNEAIVQLDDSVINVIRNNKFTSVLVPFTSAPLSIIESNEFTDSALVLYFPNSVSVINNTFRTNPLGTISNITLTAPLEVDYISSNVIIESNNFVNLDVANFNDVDVDYATLSYDLHGPCSVKNNTSVGNITTKATELTYDFEVTGIDTNVSVNYPSNFHPDLILHRDQAYTLTPGPTNTPPIYFNYFIKKFVATGTLIAGIDEVTYVFNSPTDPNPQSFNVKTNFSGSGSWTGSVFFQIYTQSNSSSVGSQVTI